MAQYMNYQVPFGNVRKLVAGRNVGAWVTPEALNWKIARNPACR